MTTALQPCPYREWAQAYRDAGWVGVLPVPARSKRLAVEGWTGRNGLDPSGADVYDWAQSQPEANVALRMPDNVLGIDVDAYKPLGAATFNRWRAEFGELPATWRSTARDDRVSGIYYYRVPAGLVWAGQLDGGSVEIIQRVHRYAMAPPSIHPDLGRAYRWYEPMGSVSLEIPGPNSFPLLPEAWIGALSRGQQGEVARADMDSGEVWEWLSGLPSASKEPCSLMRGERDRTIKALSAGVDRHDTMKSKILELLRLSVNGHAGIIISLEAVRRTFLAVATARGEDQRTLGVAQAEWNRALDGGAKLVAANTPGLAEYDICRPPFSEQLLRETAAARGRKLPTSAFAEVFGIAPDEQEELSSWDRVPDWGDALDGKLSGIAPAALARLDGPMIWYPGRINGLLGPSESGKSWVALLAVFQAVRANGKVLIIDFEDDAAGVAERVLALGLSADEAKASVVYVRPDEPLDDRNMAILMRLVADIDPVVIIIDGVNAGMTLLGLDLLDNKDATTFHQRLLRPLADTGAAVGYVDHTPKNDHDMSSAGGIGAQAKRAMTTGCAIRVEVITPFDREHPGKLRLWVDKDRAGHVRRAAVEGLVGIIHAEPADNGKRLALRFEAPTEQTDENGKLIDPVMMKVAEALATLGPSSVRAIQDAVPHKQEVVRSALQNLVLGGFVDKSPGPNRSLIHTIQRTYPHGVSVRPDTSGTRGPSGVSLPLRGDTTDAPAPPLWNRHTIDVELPDPDDDPRNE